MTAVGVTGNVGVTEEASDGEGWNVFAAGRA